MDEEIQKKNQAKKDLEQIEKEAVAGGQKKQENSKGPNFQSRLFEYIASVVGLFEEMGVWEKEKHSIRQGEKKPKQHCC